MPVTRMLHAMERWYLDPEAQTMVYRYLACEDVPSEVVEKAIDEAVAFGRAQRHPVDAEIFGAFVDTCLVDSCFGHVWGLENRDGIPSWIC